MKKLIMRIDILFAFILTIIYSAVAVGTYSLPSQISQNSENKIVFNKIVVTGAQGTGKTTMLNLFKDKFDEVITEIVRNLSKQGVKVNELGDCEGQIRIFDEYSNLLKSNKSFKSFNK